MSLEKKILENCKVKHTWIRCAMRTGREVVGFVVAFDEKILLLSHDEPQKRRKNPGGDVVVYISEISSFTTRM